MSSSVKAAVIGLGWAGQQHLAAYSRLEDVEIVGLAGLESDRLSTLAGQYGVERTFAEWEELEAWGGFDVLSIAVPTALHAPIAVQALRKGVHVLCEKPMAGSVSEAEAMVSAARDADRVLDVVFNHRHHRELQAIKRLIAGGDLGHPYHARATWLRRNGMPTGWFRTRELSGGGVLADLGIHLLDYTLDILGEPRISSVSAVGAAAFTGEPPSHAPREVSNVGDGVEDFASVFLRLEAGGVIQLDVAWAAARPETDEMHITVHGSGGGATAELTPSFDNGVVAHYSAPPQDADADLILTAAGGGHDDVVRGFVGAVLGREKAGGREGDTALERTKVIAACYESMATGREVVLR